MSADTHTPRKVHAFGWTTIAVTGLAVGAANAATPVAGPGSAGPEPLWLAQSTEGGEGGEAGHVQEGDAVVAYLTGLGIIEGKTRVTQALSLAGQQAEAVSRLPRAEDDIIRDLLPMMSETLAGEFAQALTALASAMSDTAASSEDREAAFQAVFASIAEAREHSGATEAAEAQAIVALLRDAADDYAAGVTDGSIVDPDEYRDAWGYVQVARSLSAHMAGEDDPLEKAFGQKVADAIDAAGEALPGAMPGDAPLGDASLLAAAAATAELAAYRLK
ncbi:MAG: hypothetical protein KDE03_17130 [Rhodobacteraceae bacterium]|nr:hypothetical protein [Paracoccaceae bacterium]